MLALYHQQVGDVMAMRPNHRKNYQPNLSSKHRRSTGTELILPPCHKEGSLPDELVFFSFYGV
jgi:hypothetical protein